MKLILRLLLSIYPLLLSVLTYSQTSTLQAKWLAQTDLPLSTGQADFTDAVRTRNDETYVTGRFFNGADFDTGPDTAYVRAPFAQAVFLAKYDKNGKLLFAEGFSGAGDPGYYSFSSIATDRGGNVYITGSYSTAFDFDPGPRVDSLPVSEYYDRRIFIAKYSPQGALIWAKPIFSQNDKSFSSSIAADANGNICITGTLVGTQNDFDPGPGTAALNASQDGEMFFATYTAKGEYISAQLLKGSGFIADVTMDAHGRVLLAGTFFQKIDFDPGPDTALLTSKGSGDVFFARYTLAGDYLFAKAIGGKGSEYVNQVLTDQKNAIFLAGFFSGTNTDFDPGTGRVLRSSAGGITSDAFVEKLDSAGNYVWVNTAGGTSDDYNSSLALDSKGDVYTSGQVAGNDIVFHNTTGADTLSAKGTPGVFFARYDTAGTCLYVKQLGGRGTIVTGANIFVSSQNNVLLTGTYEDSIDFNPAPKTNLLTSTYNTVFFGSYNGNNGQYITASDVDLFGWFNDESQLYKITGDKRGNTYVTGQFQGITDFAPGPPDTTLVTSLTMRLKNGFSTSDGDKFFAKYDAGGRLVFIKTIPSTYDNYMNNLTVDDDENIYICGGYDGKVNFSPGSDTAIFGTNSEYTYFGYFVKYDKSGNYVFSKNIKMPGGFGSVIVDKKKDIYVAGNFSNTANFSEPDSSVVLTAIGGTDMFFGKYDSSGNCIYIKQIGQKGGKNDVGAIDMKITPSGRMIIGGQLIGNKTDFDPGSKAYYLSSGKSKGTYFVAGYTLQGSFLFASAADTASTGDSYAINLALDGEDFVISGYYRGIVDLDPGPRVTETTTVDLASNFFIRFKSTGALKFSHAFIPTKFVDGSSNNYLTGIGVDSTHHTYIGGWYTVPTDFDFGSGSAMLTKGGSYIAKYDSLGNYEYVQDYTSYAPEGGNASNYATALWVGNGNRVVLAGEGTGNLDVDPGAGTMLFHAPVYGQHFVFFLASYQDTGSGKIPPLLVTKVAPWKVRLRAK